MSVEGKLQLATLLGLFGKFSKTEQYLNDVLEATEEKTLIYYFLYHFAALANQTEVREKYLKLALEAAEKSSSSNKQFVTFISTINDEITNKKSEAAKTYEALSEKEQDPLLKAIHLANAARVNYELGSEQSKHAITQYNKAIDIVTEVNPKHYFLPFFASRIALVYSQLHNYAKSKGVLEDKLVKLTETIYGADSFEMSQAYRDVGVQCLKLEMKATALTYFEKGLAILDKSPEIYYVNIIENLNYMALILKEAGDRHGAIAQLQNGLKLLKEYGGRINPYRATLLNGMGELLTHLGDFNSALELIESALETNLNSPEKCSHEISRNYLNLGLLYKRMGHDSMAKDFFERCIEIKCGNKGEHHFEVGALLNTLAVLHRDLADYNNALSYYQRSIDIYKRYGEHHPLIAFSLNNMAIIHKKNDKLDVALDHYKQALDVVRINVGEEHLDYAITLNNIAVVYMQKNDEDLALKTMEQSYEIIKKAHGESHPSAQNIQQNIAYLKTKIQSKSPGVGQQKQEDKTKEESKVAQPQGELKMSKSPSSNYYEEEKKEYRPAADYRKDEDLPPNLKKNASKQEPQQPQKSQQVSKEQQPDVKPEKSEIQTEELAPQVPEPKDVVIPEEYLQCKGEILKCLEKIKESSAEMYRATLADKKKFDYLCMGLIDALENYYASGNDITEEGLAILIDKYSGHFLQYNFGNIMFAQIIQQLQSRGITVIQFGGQGQEEPHQHSHSHCGCGNHEHHHHGHAGRQIQAELDADDTEAIEQLVSFGFEKEKVKNAYLLCGKDQNVTLDYLYELQENEGKQ